MRGGGAEPRGSAKHRRVTLGGERLGDCTVPFFSTLAPVLRLRCATFALNTISCARGAAHMHTCGTLHCTQKLLDPISGVRTGHAQRGRAQGAGALPTVPPRPVERVACKLVSTSTRELFSGHEQCERQRNNKWTTCQSTVSSRPQDARESVERWLRGRWRVLA